MDITSILGIVFALICILASYLVEGGTVGGILAPTAAAIVFGGTIGAVLVSFPADELKLIPTLLKIIFTNKKHDEVSIINKLAEYSDKARKEGLLILDEEAKNCENPFIQKGLSLIVDGIEPQAVREILDRESYLKDTIFSRGSKIFGAAGGYSPTMGIIGTVMGLISVLGNLEDPNELGAKIALAFVATLYGVFFANIIWLPFENKIKVKANKERSINEIIIEGLLAIQSGDSSRIIKDKLSLALIENMKTNPSFILGDGQVKGVSSNEAS